jgi:hypothetical protein
MDDALSGVTLSELYDRLVPPEAPVSISMWPQTTGWLWLALLAVVAIGSASWSYLRWKHATAYRCEALERLRLAGDDPAAIAVILRRAALSGFPRDEVAGLLGAEWLGFLDRTGRGTLFGASKAGQVLVRAPYKPQPPNEDLRLMAENWIRTHRSPGGQR